MIGWSDERRNAIPRQEQHLESCPPFTPSESNWLLMDLQGESQHGRHHQSVKGSTCLKRLHTDIRSCLRRDLCRGGKDYDNSDWIALVATKGWHLHQMDIKNAFLWSELDEEVYMVQPSGFQWSSHPIIIWRLKKRLDDLKQVARAWHSKTTQYLHQVGFKISKSDNPLFIRSDSRA